MYQDTFQRVEKKYLLDADTYHRLMERLEGRVQADHFAKSTICNIYYDTPDFRMIRASLEKPVYKEKLRLRSYGVPTAQGQAFVELKKKYKGIVYKRRVSLPLDQAAAALRREPGTALPGQIGREIGYTLDFYPELAPAMFIGYDRQAYAGAEDPALRLTFDREIRCRTEMLRLEAGDAGRLLLAPGERLLEIKIPGAIPLWLSHILDALRIFPVSYSKYGTAYAQWSAGIWESKGVRRSA